MHLWQKGEVRAEGASDVRAEGASEVRAEGASDVTDTRRRARYASAPQRKWRAATSEGPRGMGTLPRERTCIICRATRAQATTQCASASHQCAVKRKHLSRAFALYQAFTALLQAWCTTASRS